MAAAVLDDARSTGAACSTTRADGTKNAPSPPAFALQLLAMATKTLPPLARANTQTPRARAPLSAGPTT
eukprot:6501784-Lingulodinium_polyedra.AAC.1